MERNTIRDEEAVSPSSDASIAPKGETSSNNRKETTRLSANAEREEKTTRRHKTTNEVVRQV